MGFRIPTIAQGSGTGYVGLEAQSGTFFSFPFVAPLGVPVFPVLAYGITPYFMAYPGSLTLRVETYLAVVRDLLDGLAQSGFRRILLCNGHGGNAPAAGLAVEWLSLIHIFRYQLLGRVGPGAEAAVQVAVEPRAVDVYKRQTPVWPAAVTIAWNCAGVTQVVPTQSLWVSSSCE